MIYIIYLAPHHEELNADNSIDSVEVSDLLMMIKIKG
jgi:hypothetical protein